MYISNLKAVTRPPFKLVEFWSPRSQVRVNLAYVFTWAENLNPRLTRNFAVNPPASAADQIWSDHLESQSQVLKSENELASSRKKKLVIIRGYLEDIVLMGARVSLTC
jgi:hypothetical protein